MNITFEKWYAKNKDKIWDHRCKQAPSTPEEQQKVVAEIVWNLTRPGVTYTIDKTTEIKRITLTGGLQKGDCPDIMGKLELPEGEINSTLDYCPKCGSFDVMGGGNYARPKQIDLHCKTCGKEWTINED